MKYFLSILLSLSVFASGSSFDHSHSLLNEVLQKRVVFKGNQSAVDYKGLKASPQKLNSYLSQLSAVTKKEYKKFSKDEQLAFLINAYNAFTLKLIIDHYPVESIKDIGSLFTSPWKKKFFKLLGKDFWLDKIEHGMIRTDKFNEPRIHFAVNCASIGCPSLANEAFVANRLDEQLEKMANNFFANKTKNRVEGKTIKLSKIFDWYGKDFKKWGSKVGYKNYAKQKLRNTQNLDITQEYDFEFLDYDWNLNKQ